MHSPNSHFLAGVPSQPQALDEAVDEQVVRDLLVAGMSKNESVRVPAEKQVLELQKQSGFATFLLNIASDRTTDDHLRLDAILNLKTIVTRYWRPRNDPPVTNEEKYSIRARLLAEFMQEPSDLVALQVALVVGQIARLDWPRMWPDLLPILSQAFLGGPGITQLRGLLMMHHMVKEMTYRSGRGAKVQFREMAHGIFESLLSLWRQGCDLLLSTLSSYSKGEINDSQLEVVRYDAEVAKWALKILAGLVIYSFEDFSQEPLAIAFYKAILDVFPYSLECASSVQANPLMTYIHKFNTIYGKLLVQCQEHDTRPFLVIAEPVLNFALEQIRLVNHVDDTAVRCMKLTTAVILCLGKVGEYKDSEGETLLCSTVFIESRIQELVQCLVESYFTFTYPELEEWTESPEQSYHDQSNMADADDWPRSVAEGLFIALIGQWPDIVIPQVLHNLDSCTKEAQSAFTNGGEELESFLSIERVLYRDACLHTMCTAKHQLLRHIDFSDWFVNSLQSELQELLKLNLAPIYTITAPDGSVQPASFDFRLSIFKRRICLLIAHWVADIHEETRPNAYEVVVSILSNENDLGVALVAMWALECLVNEMAFEPTFSIFEPMIDPVVTAFFDLLGRCKMTDSQLKILTSMGHVIKGISSHVHPYATKILELVGELWDSTSESLMQTALIRTLGDLVVSLAGDATHWYQHLIPIINYSTQVNGRSSDNGLLEEGIILWLYTLRTATAFSPELLELFPNLSLIVQGGLTPVLLQLCLKLVESYVLLGQVDFLQAHVSDLVMIFDYWLGYIRSDDVPNLKALMRPLEIMLMLYPDEMPTDFEPILLRVLNMIFSGEETDLALCYFVHFFNRLLLHNPQFFLSWIDRVGREGGQNDLVATCINMIIDRIDQLGDIRRRKIAAMALANLVEWPELVQSETDLIALAIQTAIGVVYDEEQGEGPEYLVRPDETNLTDDLEYSMLEYSVPKLKANSVQAKQLEHLYITDPVNKFTGKQYLLQRLAASEQMNPTAYHDMLSRIEPRVLQSLNTPEDSGSDEEE